MITGLILVWVFFIIFGAACYRLGVRDGRRKRDE